MESPAQTVEELFEKAQAYSITTFELNKLRAIETSASVATSALAKLAVVLVVSIFMMVLNIGIAMLVGDALGRNWAGFLVVATFYLVLAVVFHYFLQTWIRVPVGEYIISRSLKD